MNEVTCVEAQAQLDLLAAGECDEPASAGLRRHLKACPACAASYAEAERLMGLLAVHLDESGPARVLRRIRQQERRPAVLPFARRAAAMAAMLLVTIGLSAGLRFRSGAQAQPELQLAVIDRRGGPEIKALPMRVAEASGLSERLATREPIVITLPAQQLGPAFRGDLQTKSANPPPPPAVTLSLVLTNSGNAPLHVRFGPPGTGLVLQLHGPGVVRIPAHAAPTPAFLRARAVTAERGDPYVFRVDRLVDGRPGEVEYIYLTEPGDYTLLPRLDVIANDRVVTARSGAIAIRVQQANVR